MLFAVRLVVVVPVECCALSVVRCLICVDCWLHWLERLVGCASSGACCAIVADWFVLVSVACCVLLAVGCLVVGCSQSVMSWCLMSDAGCLLCVV